MIDGDGDYRYDDIGEIETSMGQIMGCKQQTFSGTLMHDGQSRGTIIVKAEAVHESRTAVSFAYQWTQIEN